MQAPKKKSKSIFLQPWAMSFNRNTAEIETYSEFTITYEPDFRQKIAVGASIDDHQARKIGKT
jgi:hypothetical protein